MALISEWMEQCGEKSEEKAKKYLTTPALHETPDFNI
jgi:hypothetical protein